MRHPTIHLNGTSREALAAGYLAAARAVRAALTAVAETRPNGRDYYPQGENALHEALHEHDGRMRDLRHVSNELAELYETLQEAPVR